MKKPGKPKPRPKRKRGGRGKGTGSGPRLAPIAGQAVASVPGGRGWPELRLPSRLRDAVAQSLPVYSDDDRRALLLLLLPFLIVATALATNHGWRSTRPLPIEIAAPGPVLPRPANQASPAVREIALAPMPVAYPPPKPALDSWPQGKFAAPGLEVAPAWPPRLPAFDPPRSAPADADHRITAMLAPGAMAWPPALPAWRQPESPASAEGSVCAPDSPLRLAGWSPRTSRVSLGEASAAVSSDSVFGVALARAARDQTRDLVIYSARYQSIAYPLGDLHAMYGACTDVVIRAYRALGVDLQQLVQQSHAGSGDRNIDHRRTETLRRFLLRQGASLPITDFPEDYKPGDIITYHRPFSRVSSSHIAVVSDLLAPTGRPMIVHNRGWGPQLEDALFVDRITGHYRFNPATARTVSERSLALKRGGKVRSVSGPGVPVPSP